MGKFKLAKKTAIIDFAEDSPWHGVEAKVSLSVPFKTLFWFQGDTDKSQVEHSGEAIVRFGDDFLLEWNVEDDEGKPCPPTGEGLLNIDDTGLVTSLMAAWVAAVIKPSENLEEGLKDTAMSENLLTNDLANMSESLGS